MVTNKQLNLETGIRTLFFRKFVARLNSSLTLTIFFIYFCGLYLHSGLRFAKQTDKHPVVKANSQEESLLLAEYNLRKKRVKNICQKYGAYKPRVNLTKQEWEDNKIWRQLKKTSNHQFFVQKQYGLMWCKIPKAASTSWLHAFIKLANIPEDQIPKENDFGLHGFLRDKYPLLSKNLFKQFILKSIKFVVVRHPFERIISAYVDKLEDYKRDLKYRGGYYYAMYGSDIVEKYREKYSRKYPENQLFKRKEPSFVEFIDYLLDTPVENYDEHWKPQYLLCPPCHFNFDVIAKMDTFDRDTNFILRKRNLEDKIFLEKKHATAVNSTISSQASRMFNQVPKLMVEKLYEKLKVDFEMFNYSPEDFINLANDDET